MERKLKPMQERFCVEYVGDPKRNATQAAIRAGYSEKAARVQASENLTKPNILQRIKELEREALEEAGYSADSLRPLIMRQLVSIANADISDIVQVVYADDAKRKAALDQMADANGGQCVIDFGAPLLYIKPSSEMSQDERSAIRSIRRYKGELTVEMHDKQSALRLLADIVGLSKAAELNVNLSIADSIEAARARMARMAQEDAQIEGGEGTE